MTATEYREALKRLGLKQVQAAEILGITDRTSRNYARHGAPRVVAVALRLMLRQGFAAGAESAAKPGRRG